jgi:hypothetical protein
MVPTSSETTIRSTPRRGTRAAVRYRLLPGARPGWWGRNAPHTRRGAPAGNTRAASDAAPGHEPDLSSTVAVNSPLAREPHGAFAYLRSWSLTFAVVRVAEHTLGEPGASSHRHATNRSFMIGRSDGERRGVPDLVPSQSESGVCYGVSCVFLRSLGTERFPTVAPTQAAPPCRPRGHNSACAARRTPRRLQPRWRATGRCRHTDRRAGAKLRRCERVVR